MVFGKFVVQIGDQLDRVLLASMIQVCPALPPLITNSNVPSSCRCAELSVIVGGGVTVTVTTLEVDFPPRLSVATAVKA